MVTGISRGRHADPHGPIDGEGLRLGDHRRDVLDPLRRILGLGRRAAVIADVERELAATDPARRVDVVDRELDRVPDRLATSRGLPAQRHVQPDRPGSGRQPGRWSEQVQAKSPDDDDPDDDAAPPATSVRRRTRRPPIPAQASALSTTAKTATGSVTPLSFWRPREVERHRQDGLGQGPDRVADEDLAGLGDGADPGGDVDRRADVAIGRLDRLAGVDADPDRDRGRPRRSGPVGRPAAATIARPHRTASLTAANTT